MTLSQAKINELLALLRQKFPDWNGFDHPGFVEDEVAYKRAAIAKARDLLNEAELSRLIAEGRFDEFVARLEKIGQATNLLWLQAPKTGDLSVLYHAALDKPSFCEMMANFLYGSGSSDERLARYVEYVDARDLPNKWAFPTYFLFMCHPDTEIFVKPEAIKWFLEFMGGPRFSYGSAVPGLYAQIKETVFALRAALADYSPHDMVDIQGLIWVGYSAQKDKKKLAAPFSRIFTNWNEAEWVFGLLRETMERLGIKGPDDQRFALTLRHNDRVLRLDFGSWAVLQFCGVGYSKYRIGIAFGDQTKIQGEFSHWNNFANSNIRVYELPIEMVRPLQGRLREEYERTYARIVQRFQNWTASHVRRCNVSEIAEAVFDDEKRARLFAKGLSGTDRLEPRGWFTPQAFELLHGLHQDPTKEFYQAHKDEFQSHLEAPFQQLFRQIAAQLPAPIAATMETDKRIFGRILKNDYSQGGAWDFYWGAFYPKGSERTKDAQLSMWINHECFEAGFYIGEYGSAQRQRFAHNCQKHLTTLIDLLRSNLSDERLLPGNRKDMDVQPDGTVTSRIGLTWQEWLRDPAQANFDLSCVWSANQVFTYDAQTLCDEIVEVYARLFPLVLLTISDDPIPAILEYLGLEEPPEESEPNSFYPLAQCAQDTGMDEIMLSRWVRAIHRKGQAVLYGPPGTGKTYMAEKLAQHLIGGGDGFQELVQFHPAYAYEDFVQGIRPQERDDGGLSYPVVPGRFREFCRKAGKCKGVCVLIVDEINRANLSRVLGELMYLLEYRNKSIPLATGGTFSIPGNVRIIGTMNTADRSIALVDHALRRRFAFIALTPNYEVLRHYHQKSGLNVGGLINVLKRLNAEIGDAHYAVGITFFLDGHLADTLEDIWQMEIEPYLDEYFFDQPSKAQAFGWDKIATEAMPQ